MKYLNRLKQTHILFKLTFIFVSILILASIFTACFGKIFYLNTSSSAPEGIYIASINQKMQPNDYAIVSLPVEVPKLHKKAGYPMVKKVAGLQGEHYTVYDEGILFKNRLYKTFDIQDFPKLLVGTYTIPENTILFLNDPDISFDSRYLGPINKKYVQKKVSLLLPFEPFYNLKEVITNGFN